MYLLCQNEIGEINMKTKIMSILTIFLIISCLGCIEGFDCPLFEETMIEEEELSRYIQLYNDGDKIESFYCSDHPLNSNNWCNLNGRWNFGYLNAPDRIEIIVISDDIIHKATADYIEKECFIKTSVGKDIPTNCGEFVMYLFIHEEDKLSVSQEPKLQGITFKSINSPEFLIEANQS